MTLPTSGSIGLDQIMTELRVPNPGRSYPISLTDTDVLTLAGKSAPPVTMPDDFYGKSSAPPALTAEAYGNQATADTRFGNGTVSCTLTGIPRGGVKPYTNLWEFTSNPKNFVLSNANTTSPTVSATYTQNSNGGGRAILKYTVTDSVGQKAVVTDVYADLSWAGSL